MKKLLLILIFLAVSSDLAIAQGATQGIKLEKLVPSKDLITITHASSVTSEGAALDKRNPAQAAFRRKVIHVADTFLQRYMNGDLNEVELPWDWTAYNSPIMGLDVEGWNVLNGRQKSAPRPRSWKLCPAAVLVSVTSVTTMDPNALDRLVPIKGTEVRYELVIVGSFGTVKGSKQDVFFDAEKGQPFKVNVTLDQRAKVIDLVVAPGGRDIEPFGRSIAEFKRFIDFVNSNSRNERSIALYQKYTADLQQAAEVCKPQAQEQ